MIKNLTQNIISNDIFVPSWTLPFLAKVKFGKCSHSLEGSILSENSSSLSTVLVNHFKFSNLYFIYDERMLIWEELKGYELRIDFHFSHNFHKK